MEEEFKISIELDKLGKDIADGKYSIKIKDREKYLPEKPNNKLATNVVLILCNKWNQNEKSREFIKFLIRQFGYFSWKNKIERFTDNIIEATRNNVDIEEIGKYNSKSLFLKTPLIGKIEFIDIVKKFKKLQTMLDNQENDQLRAQKIDSVAEWVDNVKKDTYITNPHFGYIFGKMVQPISIDEYFGLKAFITCAQAYGVQEVIDIINKLYKREVKKAQNINNIGNKINVNTAENLRLMREKMLAENRQRLKNLANKKK